MGKTCFIALSFGSSSAYHNYGKSNDAIAKVASSAKYPVIAQWEIANLLSTEYGKKVALSVNEKPGEYLDTIAVLKDAKKFMDNNGFTHAIFIAHQDHLPRICKNAMELGIVESMLNRNVNHYIPYDSKSTQWWTRNKLFFKSREILVNIYFALKKLQK